MSDLTPKDAARLMEQLISQEALRLVAYLDDLGVLSIGIGHNCVNSPVRGVKAVGDHISLSRAIALFDADLGIAMSQVDRALPWSHNLEGARRAVLYNMAFNMGLGNAARGTGLLGFRRMLAAASSALFVDAAAEMLDSRWAGQVGRRARTLAQQMKSGEWQPL